MIAIATLTTTTDRAREIKAEMIQLKNELSGLEGQLRIEAGEARPLGQATGELADGARVQWAQRYKDLNEIDVDMLGEHRDRLTTDIVRISIRKDIDTAELLAHLGMAGIDATEWLDFKHTVAVRQGADESASRLLKRGVKGAEQAAQVIASAQYTPKVLL